MAAYLDPQHTITAHHNNITFNADGTIWAHYILQGINYSPADQNSYEYSQQAHQRLFAQLATLSHIDYSLHGFKTHIPLNQTLHTINKGLPADFTPQKYPIAATNIAALRDRKNNGHLREFQRIYWLAARIPDGSATSGTIIDKIVRREPLDGMSPEDYEEEEQDVYGLIPREFTPQRATLNDIYWCFDRMRYRGIRTIPTPESQHHDKHRTDNGFPQIIIDKLASTQPILDKFIDDYVDDEDEAVARATRTYKSNYKMVKNSTMLSISSPATQTPQLPGGVTSFQSSVVITGYPSNPTQSLMTYTSMADQNLGVDADFTLRFKFDPSMLSKDEIRKFRNSLKYQADSTSKDDLDLQEYQKTGSEAIDFQSTVMRPNTQIPFKVCSMFTFAHPDREQLMEATSRIIDTFEKNGYSADCIVGAQYDLLRQGMPGIGTSKLVESYMEATTVEDFAPSFPLRRTISGDSAGIPIAINRENSFGQLIYYDIIKAPDKGNASISVTGAQGSGKSYFMKNLCAWVAGLHCATHIFDPSPTGEYEDFVKSLATQDPMVNVDVQNFANPKYSMDPLKIYSDPDMAKTVFTTIMFPLLNIKVGSPVMGAMTNYLKAENREIYRITSTRRLLEIIESEYSANSADELGKQMYNIAGFLRFIADHPAGRALVDPVGKELPPINLKTNVLVYRTGTLKTRDRSTDKNDIEATIGTAIYNSCAEFTGWAFQRLKKMPCFTIGDEMSFLSDSPETLKKLVKEPTRQGRKYNKALISGTQDATDLDENYNQISKVMVFRQERRENAEAALKYAGLPDSDYMINRLMNDTSPRDDNGVIPGRNGEGWFVDGVHYPVRMQTLPALVSAQSRAADTRASVMSAKEVN